MFLDWPNWGKCHLELDMLTVPKKAFRFMNRRLAVFHRFPAV